MSEISRHKLSKIYVEWSSANVELKWMDLDWILFALGNVDNARELIQNVDVNTVDENGTTPLYFAIEKGNFFFKKQMKNLAKIL